jgi:hypothetical protein
MAERGKSDLNKSRETFSLEGERSSKGGERSHLSVGVGTGWGRTCALVRLASERTIAPGGAIVLFLSRFGTLEEGSANDHPRKCDRSLPQNAIPHLSEPRN